MSQNVNFVWPQGEDLLIQLNYREGKNTSLAKPVNLSAGYEARMDIVNPTTRAVLHSVSSNSGGIVLSNGVTAPNINIVLSRALSVSGPFATAGSYPYDLFLRNTATNLQIELIEGTINVKRSNTLWA